jgi:endonuclease/exonuclease/phosphatase family metal-dependent hydrolase
MALLVAITALAVSATYLLNRYVVGAGLDPDRQQRSLRILTWNIGKLYLKWDSRASDRDLGHVARVIQEVEPHVVALQELRGPTQLGRLATLLGPGWRAKVPEDQYDRRAGLLLRLPARFVNLPTSTGRTAQGASVTLRGGLQLAVASLHLDAFDARRRLTQAEEILAGAKRVAGGDMVLAGDFNFDAATVSQDSIDQRIYRFLTRELVDAAEGAGATTVISRRLDYVFFRCAQVTGVSSRVIRDRRINIMDHDPLLVELKLR